MNAKHCSRCGQFVSRNSDGECEACFKKRVRLGEALDVLQTVGMRAADAVGVVQAAAAGATDGWVDEEYPIDETRPPRYEPKHRRPVKRRWWRRSC